MNSKTKLLLTTDWVMDPVGRKVCNVRFFSPLLKLMEIQKTCAQNQIEYLDTIIEFLKEIEKLSTEEGS